MIFNPILRNSTWIHREKSSPLQTYKFFFLFFCFLFFCYICIGDLPWRSTSSSGVASTMVEYRRPFMVCMHNSVETWATMVVALGTSSLAYIYIYIYIYIYNLLKKWWRFSFNIYNMHGKSQTFHKWFPYIYIYMLTHVLLIYSILFFLLTFFFQGRKKLTFFEHVSAFIICKDEFDFR